MAPVLQVQAVIASSRKVSLCLLVLYALMLLVSSASLPTTSSTTTIVLFGRRLLENKHVLQESHDDLKHIKNKTKFINTTKPSKIATSNKNSTKPNKDSSFQEKPIKDSSLHEKPIKDSSFQEKPTSKTTNFTRKPVDTTKKTKSLATPLKKLPVKSSLGWDYEDEDFVAEFIDLPSRVQETLLPDLEVLSATSKAYLDKANKEITNGFKPIFGKKYAPIVASIVSFVFILTPFLLISLIFNQIKPYFSLQKLVIFIHFYLSIYFSILCLTSLVTGLDPLKFFYATSQSTYLCIQVLQSFAYVLYLLVVLVYFVLVFSTETGMGTKLLGFGQMFVGFAVGFHCYATVFHRAVLHQPPKSSWKFHGIYSMCFLLICILDREERRKKVYVVDGSEEEGKLN